MFIGLGRRFGRHRRWFGIVGGRVSILWTLMLVLMGGLVLYTLIVGHTP